jgi:pimeloyl-ACP methyl ester carboxylesterase
VTHEVSPDPVILIHGAWQGAWVWDHLVPHLRAANLETHPIDLPGNGCDTTLASDVSLDLYLDFLSRRLRALGRPASLVAHSGGGVVASALAEAQPACVTRIAYVAGMMLPDGLGFADLIATLDDPDVAGVGPHLVWSADGMSSVVPPDVAAAYFFQDCPPETAAAAAARLTPQPEGGRAIRPCLTPDRFGRVPRLYVEASEDRAVAPRCQKSMQTLVPGARVITLPTGHAPHLSAPRELAAALLPFLLGSEVSAVDANRALL